MGTPESDFAICQRNLRHIHLALEAYRRDHGDYPRVLTQLSDSISAKGAGLYPGYIKDKNIFICPVKPDISSGMPPRYVEHSYAYLFGADPNNEFARRHIAFLREMRRKLRQDTTVVWCAGHGSLAPPDALHILALKVDGRLVWEPMGTTRQERMMRAFNRREEKVLTVVDKTPPPR